MLRTKRDKRGGHLSSDLNEDRLRNYGWPIVSPKMRKNSKRATKGYTLSGLLTKIEFQ